MRGSVVTVNRALYLALGLVAAGVAALPAGVSTEPPAGAEAVSVPAVAVAGPRSYAIDMPERNPFAADGQHWRPEAQTPQISQPQPAGPKPVNLRGLIRIGSLEGVFVDDGYVAVGEALQGGRLEAATEGGAVIRSDQGERRLVLDPDRKKRRNALLADGP